MQIHPQPKQKPSPFFDSAPKRSLSYNDLKRKRLIRSEKSKTKLHPEQSQKQKLIIRTEKKKPQQHFTISQSSAPNTAQDIRKIERSINQLKDVFDEIREKAKTKKYIISKPFYSDRVNNNDQKRKISFLEKSSTGNGKMGVFYESVDMAGNQKELIKQIISKKKSQRRLLKFDEIRAEVKRSKSRSKSKLNINQEETAPHSKIINQSSSQQVMQRSSRSRKNVRINKFQSVPERHVFKSDIQKPNTQILVNNYQTSTAINKEPLTSNEKSQYRSRRKLKIEDFKTERTHIEMVKQGQKHSEVKLKFHRRLRKTNSQIIIKTTQNIYNKSKYTSRLESKSTLNMKQFSQKQEKAMSRSVFSKPEKSQSLFQQANNQQDNNTKKDKHTSINYLTSNSNDNQPNQFKDLQLSAINISEIQIRKQNSFTEIDNDISLVNALQAQQLSLEMKKSKSKTISNPSEENKQLFKKPKKQTPLKSTSTKLQNVQNIENLSNLLDFISLPTEELKVKINRCSTKVVKKKNEMEKFKKIFPVNFFNK